jgi:hypothetical protein
MTTKPHRAHTRHILNPTEKSPFRLEAERRCINDVADPRIASAAGPLVPIIDAILEADKTAPPKQRHTAKRIFERLGSNTGLPAARRS